MPHPHQERALAQPEEAILEEVARGSLNMVLIGVSRRPAVRPRLGSVHGAVPMRQQGSFAAESVLASGIVMVHGLARARRV
jgi:hypothetical protein